MTSTLRVQRTGLPPSYAILSEDAPVATVSAHTLRHGGDVEVSGERYSLERSTLGRGYRLHSAAGQLVASAERTGRQSWDIEAEGRRYQFSRSSFGSAEHVLRADDEQVGHVRRVRRSGRNAEADLAGLSRPVEAFVLVVALGMWQRKRRAVAVNR